MRILSKVTILRVCGFIYALFLVYCCFLLPFTQSFDVNKPFNNTKEFTIAYTASGIVLTGTAIGTNIFICCVLLNGNRLTGPLNFLLVNMAIADAIEPLFHFPIEIAIHWILLQQGPSASLFDVKLVLQYTQCFRSAFGRLSIYSLMAISLFRFQRKITKTKKMSRISMLLKLASVFLILSCSVVLTTFQFRNYFKEWQHKYDAVSTIYAPLAVTLLFVYGAYCCTDRSSHDAILRGRRLVLYGLIFAYVICWLPWYSIQMFQDFCCLMPYYGEYDHDRTNHITSNFVQLKGCLNIFIILLFDLEFQEQMHDLRSVFCRPSSCCSTRKNNMHTELNSISISYYRDMDRIALSNNDGEYIMNWLRNTSNTDDIDINKNIKNSDTEEEEGIAKADDTIPLMVEGSSFFPHGDQEHP